MYSTHNFLFYKCFSLIEHGHAEIYPQLCNNYPSPYISDNLVVLVAAHKVAVNVYLVSTGGAQ